MKEFDVPPELNPNRESPNEVFNNLLLLSGEPAASKIAERIIDSPDIRRVVIFGEPGANKTTIILQLATELINIDPTIDPSFVFYDNALSKVKSSLDLDGIKTKRQHDLVSEVLSHEMNTIMPQRAKDRSLRSIQFVELVGIGSKNRGKSTLWEVAESIKDQGPMVQEALVIGVAADSRSLKDAGKVRKAVDELVDPLEVFDLLRSFKIQLSKYPRNEDLGITGARIIEFFRRMASDSKIELIHSEIAALARQRSAEDEDRLFRMLSLPDLPYPIETIEDKQGYLLNAAFLQGYLQELGLKKDMYDTSFRFSDKGLVVFSPYNPEISKNIDLSRALS